MGFFWMIRRGCCPSTANSNLDALSSTRDTHSTLSEFLLRISDGLLALFIAFLAQLLIAGIQCALDGEGIDFPASILAMAAVFIAFSVAGCAFPGVDGFYQKRLKRAVSIPPSETDLTISSVDDIADRTLEPPHVDWVYCTRHHDLPRPCLRWPYDCYGYYLLP